MDRPALNPSFLERALAAPRPGSSDYDLNPDARPRRAQPLRPASVLVPLVERGTSMNVILTRRAARLRHHPGQIAFPGGKQDAGDASPLAAALREAHEEIGLEPGDVTVLGTFDAHETVTHFLISPFVGLVSPAFEPRIDRTEVDETFEVPLAFLLDPANLQIHRFRRMGHWRHYYAIPYGPHYIWGATARMLKALGDRVRSA
ncbi:CoA pyrophosphatase [Rhodobacteraceae bacterium DSL-40]|uniref:CoA pyrophosphatase n=1 Tax=Amaricoccus sp. B4 TaxID=3368557 RepID=UPI000DABBCDD